MQTLSKFWQKSWVNKEHHPALADAAVHCHRAGSLVLWQRQPFIKAYDRYMHEGILTQSGRHGRTAYDETYEALC